MDKVVRDGKVAVLVCDKGSDFWSFAFDGDVAYKLAHHPLLVIAKDMNYDYSVVAYLFQALTGDASSYAGAWYHLSIRWVTEGDKYRIVEWNSEVGEKLEVMNVGEWWG